MCVVPSVGRHMRLIHHSLGQWFPKWGLRPMQRTVLSRLLEVSSKMRNSLASVQYNSLGMSPFSECTRITIATVCVTSPLSSPHVQCRKYTQSIITMFPYGPVGLNAEH